MNLAEIWSKFLPGPGKGHTSPKFLSWSVVHFWKEVTNKK